MSQRRYDLEDRLIEYTCRMIEMVESLPSSRAGNYISAQLIRACHSPAFNYGEALAAESIKDFIHKMAIVLKELRECRIALKIIMKRKLIVPASRLELIYKETNELIAIFGKSVATAKEKLNQKLSND